MLVNFETNFFIFMIIGLSPAYILNSAFVKTKQIKCESYLFVIWSGVESSSCPQHFTHPSPLLTDLWILKVSL